MKVRVTCKADTFLPLSKIMDFQGELKTRTLSDVEHLISSIERHGFAFPFFIWKQPNGTCSCLDGHGRIMALTQMQKEGYEIPELPVVYIEAEDEGQARTKLIHINSVAGRFTEGGFRDLVKDIPDLNLNEYTFPDLDLERIEKEMEVLKRAEQNIQLDKDWEKEFADVGFVDEESPSSSSGIVASVSNMPNTRSHTDSVPDSANTVSVTGNAETPDVIGIASTQYGQDTQLEDITVYCPECGLEFRVSRVSEENNE